MLKQIEKHKLFTSIDAMLKPETLSALTGRNITKVATKSMSFEEHNGHSGSQMSYIETDNGGFFMKQMGLDTDYIMNATDDALCRQVTLWQHGLLDELQAKIQHGIIAVANEGNSWALLMRDLSAGLFSEDKPFDDDMFWFYLDRLAYIHATFWNDSRLENPTLGLMTPHKFSSCFSTENIASGGTYNISHFPDWMVGSKWLLGGWKALERLVAEDVYRSIEDLTNDPQTVIDAAMQFPRTLVHGDYRKDNFAYFNPADVTVFDWQFSSYNLMTADLFNLLLGSPITQHDEIKTYYRNRLEHYLGINFDNDEWDQMVDLGLCLYALQRICVISYLTTLDQEAYDYFSPRVRLLVQWILDVHKWV